MAKYISLFGGTTTDTTVQVVKENQIVIGYGPYMAMNRYVVYKVEHTDDGYIYHLLNLDTKKTDRTDILQPLSRKHGIGRYYDDANPQFMDAFEVALLVEEAEKQAAEEARQAEQERQRVECVKAVGRERFAALLPPTAKAVIVAELRQDESDHMTDYFAYRTVRTVILGFSSHTRDLFSEMRKHASNFPETAYLAEANEEYEHREKYSMGAGYDDANPQFMDAFEVALLVEEAEKQAAEEARQAEQERQRVECVKAVGRERFAALLPPTAKAVIVAELRQDESDHMTDYFAYRTVRTVILGFSSHTRDLFSEMRKHASNFPETAYLAEANEEYEHREKYSMGAGYYLGQSKYYGWIIHKSPIYNRERTIEDFAYIAGDEANIRLSNATAERSGKRHETVVQDDFVIVDYSDKAIAVFGDTKPIKTELSALGGRFNSRLTHEGEKKAGWIFQKSKEEQVRRLIGMNE